MHFVYIIYSVNFDSYYVGETNNVLRRLSQHNDINSTYSTKRYQPWLLKMTIEVVNRSQARKVESFIKKQKSKKFIEKLIKERDNVEFIKNLLLKIINK